MVEQYNLYIVVLSIIIAIIASLLSLTNASNLSNAKGKSKLFWLVSGSIVMGSGIWSMHFIGMIAYHPHIQVSYNVWITTLSLVVSILSSFIAFYVTMPKIILWYRIVVGGVMMGSGIVIMHYFGMAAMEMDAQISYNSTLVVLSVLIAFIASYVAVLLFIRFRNRAASKWLKSLSAIVMGVAIAGMHYTGMAAVSMEFHHSVSDPTNIPTNHFLLYGVTIIVIVILLVSWGTMIFDRHVLNKMAYQDTVTQLSNRNALNKYFNTNQDSGHVSVLFLDLDSFKSVNDTLGHQVGDELLETVGLILHRHSHEGIEGYRIGGDEFILLINHSDKELIEQLAVEILEEINQPSEVDNKPLYISASIGISLGLPHQKKGMKILEEADIAMYKAKESGKNQYAFYTDEMGEERIRRIILEHDLRRAIENEQLFILYQPKFNIKTSSIVGVEALTRWQHPTYGYVSPMEFITMAEETNYIMELTEWTLEKAFVQATEWSRMGISLPIAINLSIKFIENKNVKGIFEDMLSKYKLDPSYLEVEITETVMYSNMEQIIQQMNQLRQLGIRVSMDDFGTGYSSISLLNTLPLDTIKLDKTFIDNIDDKNKQVIIGGILSMAEQLNLSVVTEGIETKDEEEILTCLGGYLVQGYYYSKPKNAAGVLKMIREQKGVHL
ncbi:bifunctional diguanylate cyclase/phosphodiesterase [Gracilibacillus thailandensis]|uniref:EAL domain-containing protein n=1 Tax=Gracilibacillus thailandensis TaxID=563735 RepID=A0A6N7QZ64_9BACI|nr:bifunctional diguanylate cyclase/phosphodiesterase [Gracilibacillus thailandensis]MRI67367.1 EAL domain-containing protein [Gracilibacillus thailandensis]